MAIGQRPSVLRCLRRVALAQECGGMTDRQLLECFVADRDEAAFAALVRRHGPMVLGVCRRVLRHAHDAEDAFQAAFLVLARKAASLTQRDLVGNWLYGVAYRAALEAKAARRRVKERQVSAMPEPPAADEADHGNDLWPVLDQELSRLPDKYRVPIVLCDLEGRTRREAARQLGLPEGTLSGRLTTARRMLARRLARHGLALSVAGLATTLSQQAATAKPPALLVMATTRAAMGVAAGNAVVPPGVSTLSEGVLKAMLLTKLKIVLATLLVLAVCAGAGLWSFHAEAAGPVKSKADEPGTPKTPSAFLKGDFRFGRLAWSPDGKTLLSVTYDQKGEMDNPLKTRSAVRLWDLPRGEVKRTLAEDELKVMQFVRLWTSVAFSPDGKTVAAVSDGGGEDTTHVGIVMVWDGETGKIKQTLKHTLLVRAVAFAPDGKTLATATGGNVDRDFETVQLWDPQTGQLLRSLETTNKMAVQVAFDPDGKTLAVVLQMGEGQTASTEVLLWDAVEGKVLHTLPESDGFHAMAFSSDGKSLLGAARNKLGEWDVATGKAVRTADIQADFSETGWSIVAFAPGGKTVAISGKQNDRFVVTLWDVKTAKLTRTLQGDGVITSLAFSRTGTTLAAGSEDGTVRFWDIDPAARPKE